MKLRMCDALNCPICGTKCTVYNSRFDNAKRTQVRYRICDKCGVKWKTVECFLEEVNVSKEGKATIPKWLRRLL